MFRESDSFILKTVVGNCNFTLLNISQQKCWHYMGWRTRFLTPKLIQRKDVILAEYQSTKDVLCTVHDKEPDLVSPQEARNQDKRGSESTLQKRPSIRAVRQNKITEIQCEESTQNSLWHLFLHLACRVMLWWEHKRCLHTSRWSKRQRTLPSGRRCSPSPLKRRLAVITSRM